MTFAGSAVAFSTMLFAIGAQRADLHQTSHVLLQTAFERAADPQLASYKILEPSWVFYAGRPINELPHGKSVEEYGAQHILEHLTLHSEGFVIVTDETLAGMHLQLPPEFGVVAETARFLKDERLVLLGRVDSPANVASGEVVPPNLQLQR
jgi:hypothetical protein